MLPSAINLTESRAMALTAVHNNSYKSTVNSTPFKCIIPEMVIQLL